MVVGLCGEFRSGPRCVQRPEAGIEKKESGLVGADLDRPGGARAGPGDRHAR